MKGATPVIKRTHKRNKTLLETHSRPAKINQGHNSKSQSHSLTWIDLTSVSISNTGKNSNFNGSGKSIHERFSATV